MATLDLELRIDDALKALTLTLLPCRFDGESTCFALGTDITEYRALHRALEASGESLRRQAAALEDATTALRRPNLTDKDPLDEIVHLLARRGPIYRESADLEIDTEGKTPAEIAAEILRRMSW